MTDDGWIPFQTATLILGGDGAVRRLKEALILGNVKSRGIVPRSLSADPEEPVVTVEIPGDRWALWVFLPISEVSLNRRRLQWLVPAGSEHRRVCAGYCNVMLSREDVDRLSEAQRRAQELRAETTHPGPSAPLPREVLSLKPGFWGISIDLKELWRRCKELWRRWRRPHQE